MFILKSILAPVQSIFQKSSERGQLFVAVLLAMLFPVGSARGSQILRLLQLVFRFNITRRRFYTFMTSPKLPWSALWQCVWQLIPSPLTDGRLLLAADDSINPKTGKKVHACDYHYAHALKANQSKYVWSQNIVQVGLLKWIHGRFACLPLKFCFYRLQKSLDQGFKTKIEQVVEMVIEIYRFFKCPVLLIVDNWFAAKTLVHPLKKALGAQFHLLSRLRTNTKLYSQKIPTYRGRGRPPKYGKLLGYAKDISKKRKSFSKTVTVFLYGKQREIKALSTIYCLKTLGLPVRVVFVYYRKHSVVLFSTDLTLSVEKIIEYYGARWKIEAGFKELKQDIGSQRTQARSKNAVTNHLNFCMMAVTLTWIYASRLFKQPSRRQPNNRSASFAFSDVRYLISQVFLSKDFLKVFFKSKKTLKNNLFPILFQLAA